MHPSQILLIIALITSLLPFASLETAMAASQETRIEGVSPRDNFYLVNNRRTVEKKDGHMQYNRLGGDLFGKQDDAYSFSVSKPGSTVLIDRDRFFADLESRECRDRPLVIFVHGCCVSLGEMFKQARGLKNAFEKQCGPIDMVCYDWSTPSGNYPASLSRVEAMNASFNEFLQQLPEGLKSHKGRPLILVTHSLGAYCLVDRRSKDSVIDRDSIFSACFFSRPDITQDQFFASYPAFKNIAGRYFLLKASNDPNLKLSALVRSRPFASNRQNRRLGLFADDDALERLDPERLSVIDVSELKLGHVIPYEKIASLYKEMIGIKSGETRKIN